MAINILKSCKSVFAYVKNRSSPSHIRSSFPWRPPLAEILDPRLVELGHDSLFTLFVLDLFQRIEHKVKIHTKYSKNVVDSGASTLN